MDDVNEVLKELSKNMTIFKKMKMTQISDNEKYFLDLYFLIVEAADKLSPTPSFNPEQKIQVRFLLGLGYTAGYRDALK